MRSPGFSPVLRTNNWVSLLVVSQEVAWVGKTEEMLKEEVRNRIGFTDADGQTHRRRQTDTHSLFGLLKQGPRSYFEIWWGGGGLTSNSEWEGGLKTPFLCNSL